MYDLTGLIQYHIYIHSIQKHVQKLEEHDKCDQNRNKTEN